MQEIIKMLICLYAVAFHERIPEGQTMFSYIKKDLMNRNFLYSGIPAVIYTIQNNLLYYSLSVIDIAHYTIMIQMKIFTAAIFSVVFLGRRLNMKRYFSLFLLVIGVITINLNLIDFSGGRLLGTGKVSTDFIKGMMAVLGGTVCSGLAGISIEYLLKSSSLWLKNIQFCIYGIGLSIIISFCDDKVWQYGLFYDFDWVVLLVILIQAAGGILVALVVKHTNIIVKGYASSFSLVISTTLSFLLFEDTTLDTTFGIGAILVVVAAHMYRKYGDETSKENKNVILASVSSSKELERKLEV
eukprot:TRINITY_DN2038_c1_g1_i2.p2 TRINITY_DN2038_c1_g1~~TRINITY_DN2038_c1_g1_i2.p2  ORF type:complete len:299 (-),score=49.31 TRINITY_DN2038_c1_g1_i2:44-940(-)